MKSLPIFILLVILIASNVSAQFQPQELNSVIWLLNQYGVATIPQTEAGICASSPTFTCQMGTDGFNHIITIEILSSVYQNTGVPPPITEFYFPSLTTFKLDVANTVADPGLNILSLMKNIPLLTSIFIHRDLFTDIPTGFATNCPLLVDLKILQNPNLVSISNFFSQSNIQKVIIQDSPISSITIDQTTYVPNLISFIIDLVVDVDLTLTFTEAAFPALVSINFKATSATKTMNVIFDLPVKFVASYVQDKNSLGAINPTFSHPETIIGLAYGGPNYVLTPSNLDLYTSLDNLQILYTTVTTFPVTPYPKVPYFTVSHGNLQSLPSVPIPITARDFSFRENQLTGDLPSNLLANNPNRLKLGLFDNPGITGTLGQEYCYIESISISNTGLTAIPDCFWCYMISQGYAFVTDLQKPATLDCTVTVDNLNLLSVNGRYNVTGDLIGWGRGIDYVEDFKPNRALIFNDPSFQIKGLNYNRMITFSSTDFTFNITEVGFACYNQMLMSNNLYMFEYKITCQNFNPTMPPTIKLKFSGQECVISKYDNVKYEIFCLLVNPKIGADTFIIANQYHSNEIVVFISQNPVVTSFTLEPPTYPPTYLNMYGLFSLNTSPENTVIYFNYTAPVIEEWFMCNVTFVNTTYLRCIFTRTPDPGFQTMFMSTESTAGQFQSNTIPYIPAPLPTIDNCKNMTNNCHGHGTCVNGQCQCDEGWTDFDCKIEKNPAPGVIIQPNYTDPTVNFTHGDYSFSFNLISIQELDYENKLINELATDKWNVTSNNSTDLTSISYLFNNQNKSSLYDYLVVKSVVEFSSKPRSIDFGGDLIQISAGSIKIGVNITNWPYKSLMSTLRVVFSTVINNNQSIVGCDNSVNTIDTFQQSADNGTLQYLRVVKDDVQFFGRFLDFMVSDGRKTYSKTQVMNVTAYGDAANNQSLAIIGIHVPQCTVCLVDPDFSALLVDRTNYDTSGTCTTSEKNENWKIIVGIVVGVVGAIAISIGTFIFVKKNRKVKKFNTMMEKKLQALNAQNDSKA
ncbi:hypothetical protein DFA_08364 [Cavenderia fasciculata]|uniref:EGF-like domain-containing protein n=1 Tax=Cavenderia fasciculata TaxID=261658 RepID=F4Q5W0_CACFS|nr:uncharacterized protein DFA_08364 [Cavenderia fasciculata]EGG17369.1 hypothetical protein DFA_08364 [Cavenderia fasciculata]|eukprot:XP_004355853.1 hypothetical protein DFA_08364 [Cavenderia fasciculata]